MASEEVKAWAYGKTPGGGGAGRPDRCTWCGELCRQAAERVYYRLLAEHWKALDDMGVDYDSGHEEEVVRIQMLDSLGWGLRVLVRHHPDYSRPDLILWLCSRCHGMAHREANKARQADLFKPLNRAVLGHRRRRATRR